MLLEASNVIIILIIIFKIMVVRSLLRLNEAVRKIDC
jgi:hypothetical protein